MGRKFLVGGNWKMNGDGALVQTAATGMLAAVPPETEVVVAPPYPYLAQLRDAGVVVAAQNVSEHAAGAFTGEVSVAMLEDLRVGWAIVGHSERRTLYHESSELVGKKLRAVLGARSGLRAIVCIGETLTQRDAGQTRDVLAAQLQALLSGGTEDGCWSERVVIAYEPVWAIGTGKAASPNDAQEMHRFIRGWIGERLGAGVAEAVRIIYGGSVNGKNCRELAALPDVDGFLVGGASLKPEFRDIIRARHQ